MRRLIFKVIVGYPNGKEFRVYDDCTAEGFGDDGTRPVLCFNYYHGLLAMDIEEALKHRAGSPLTPE